MALEGRLVNEKLAEVIEQLKNETAQAWNQNKAIRRSVVYSGIAIAASLAVLTYATITTYHTIDNAFDSANELLDTAHATAHEFHELVHDLRENYQR